MNEEARITRDFFSENPRQKRTKTQTQNPKKAPNEKNSNFFVLET